MKDFLIQNCSLITTIAFAWFTAYLSMILIKYHSIGSISESDARLKKPWGWLFEATMFISGIAIISNGFALGGVAGKLLMLGGGFIFCVGIFTDYKSNIHIFFASLGFIISVAAFLWTPLWWGVPIVVGAALLAHFNSEKHDNTRTTLNVEIVLSVLLFLLLSNIR